MSDSRKPIKEGLGLTRMFMVLSSLAPLFLLMAIRGNGLIPETYFVTGCVAFAVLPTLVLLWRVRSAKRNKDEALLTAGKTEDHRSHLLVYLFATLLPFYREEICTARDMTAMCFALVLIVYVFWHLKLHYMNLLFSLFGYRVFTVSPPDDGNPHTRRTNFVVLTKREQMTEGSELTAYRLSDDVFLEG